MALPIKPAFCKMANLSSKSWNYTVKLQERISHLGRFGLHLILSNENKPSLSFEIFTEFFSHGEKKTGKFPQDDVE